MGVWNNPLPSGQARILPLAGTTADPWANLSYVDSRPMSAWSRRSGPWNSRCSLSRIRIWARRSIVVLAPLTPKVATLLLPPPEMTPGRGRVGDVSKKVCHEAKEVLHECEYVNGRNEEGHDVEWIMPLLGGPGTAW